VALLGYQLRAFANTKEFNDVSCVVLNRLEEIESTTSLDASICYDVARTKEYMGDAEGAAEWYAKASKRTDAPAKAKFLRIAALEGVVRNTTSPHLLELRRRTLTEVLAESEQCLHGDANESLSRALMHDDLANDLVVSSREVDN